MIGVDLSRKVIPGDHLNLETCELQKVLIFYILY
jgi:hypothetical protein